MRSSHGPGLARSVFICMLFGVINNMGSLCSKQRHNATDTEENAQVNLFSEKSSNRADVSDDIFIFSIGMPYLSFCCFQYIEFQTVEIERRIELESKAEKHIQKLLLLGICSSSCSCFLLFWLLLSMIVISLVFVELNVLLLNSITVSHPLLFDLLF